MRSATVRHAVAVLVRERIDADLDPCERLVREIHRLDGYPVFMPVDLRSFIGSPDSYLAWVAEHEGQIVGHAALHRRLSLEAFALARKVLGQRADGLGVVARLFVAPSFRRAGLGQLLLEIASQEAHARGLWPVLDVVTDHHAAIRLYDACGWERIGEITFHFDDGNVLNEFVYVGPPPPGGKAVPR
jgi:GNAT superfamily N-acetyltransferase